MLFSWLEILEILNERIESEIYHDLDIILDNIRFLNNSYYQKRDQRYKKLNEHINAASKLNASVSQSEQLIDKLQALSEDINASLNADPLMYKQVFIMDRMKAAGYKITGMGECYGLTNMAIQAFYANDLDTFYQRLQMIYDMPLEDFANDFSGLRQKQQEAKGQEEAEAISQLLVDLPAFFDSVALIQRPNIYLPDENNQPLSKKQDVEKTLPITQPVILEQAQNNIEVLTSFTGAYTKQDLNNYLALFEKNAQDIPLALNLICHMHAITLLYEPSTKYWTLIDPNHLPAKEFRQIKHLCDAVFDHFNALARYSANIIKEGTIVMATQLITTTELRSKAQNMFDNITLQEKWVDMHSRKRDFQDTFGLSPNTLYEHFYRESVEESDWSDSLLLDIAIDAEQNDVIIEYATNNGIDIFVDKSIASLRKVLLILPVDLQGQLLEKLSLDQKVEVVSSRYSASSLKLFQILPEQERLAIYRKINNLSQSKYTSLLSSVQIKNIFDETALEEKCNFISSLKQDSFAVFFCEISNEEKEAIFLKLSAEMQGWSLVSQSKQASQFLWDLLSTEEQINILETCTPSIFIKIFQVIDEKQLISHFPKMSYKQLGSLLLGLDEDKVLQAKLLMQLSDEEKVNILRLGPERRFTYKNWDYEISMRFYSMLDERECITIFLKLSAKEQSNLLIGFYIEKKIDVFNEILFKLSSEQKSNIINEAYNIKHEFFRTISDEEHVETFFRLTPISQYEILKKQNTQGCKAHLVKLIEALSFEQTKNIIIHNMKCHESEKVLNYLFEHLSEEERFIVLEEKSAVQSYFDMYHFLEHSAAEFVIQFISSLSAKKQFEFLSEEIVYLVHLPLNVGKAILQNKIIEEISRRTSNHTIFDIVKQDIANAVDKHDLAYCINEINNLVELNPSNELVIADMTALEIYDDTGKAHSEKSLTLHQMLQFMGLEKENLSSTSLKRIWLNIHPDKAVIEPENILSLKKYINALKVFLSVNELSSYYELGKEQVEVNGLLCGLTFEDEVFLVKKAVTTINQSLKEEQIDLEFLSELKEFVEANSQAHQRGTQSCLLTIHALSKSMSAVFNLKERRRFLKAASYYKLTASQAAMIPERAESKDKNESFVRSEYGLFKIEEAKQAGNEVEPGYTHECISSIHSILGKPGQGS